MPTAYCADSDHWLSGSKVRTTPSKLLERAPAARRAKLARVLGELGVAGSTGGARDERTGEYGDPALAQAALVLEAEGGHRMHPRTALAVCQLRR